MPTDTNLMTMEESKLFNEELFEKLSTDDRTMNKQGADAVTEYTRTRMREDGVWRRVMPMTPATNDHLTREMDNDEPVIVIDKEPESPAAMTLPFGAQPTTIYIEGDRYKVHFVRLATPRAIKDVDQLRTWIIDLRQVMSDNMIRDMLAEEDGAFIRGVNTAVVGPGLIVPTSGVVQHELLNGGIDRDSLWDSMKVLPNTPSNLETHTVLLNNITIKDVAKLTHNEMGGEVSANIMKDGWTMETFMGIRYLITIKKGLVPTGTMYHFADPKFVGKALELEPTTMYVRREAFMIEFYSYELIGGSIGNTSGVARVDFD